MKNILSKITLGVLTAVLSTACSLDFDPTTSYSEKTFWYSAKNAKAGLTACYQALREDGLYGGATMVFEETATPNAFNYANNSGWNSIAEGRQTTSTAIFANRWKGAYVGIGRCNFLLGNIDYNRELSGEEITQMKAQARFLRAFYYSILTTYYYKVPLITDSPGITQVGRTRIDRSTLIDFITTELDETAAILPRSYVSKSDSGRATAGAALALKARVLNFEASALLNPSGDAGKWTAAADAAEAVINMGVYGLYGNYKNLFSEDAEHSNESIFNVEAVGSPAEMGHSTDLTMRQYGTCAPLRGLVDAYWMKDGKPRSESAYKDSPEYADMDPRFASTIVYPGGRFMGETVKPDGTNVKFKVVQTGYTFRKYTVYDENTPAAGLENIGQNSSPINLMILRYADILLLYAEAMNESGRMSESVWNRTVRLIRQRAGFSGTALDYPGDDKAVITGHIRYERRIEFAGEGTWYNDLRRWKEAENLMDGAEGLAYDGDKVVSILHFNRDRDYWWPVPSTQITAAPTLAPNNPGWDGAGSETEEDETTP